MEIIHIVCAGQKDNFVKKPTILFQILLPITVSTITGQQETESCYTLR